MSFEMLSHLRIVVTRANHQAEALAEPLRARGAEVIFLPLIAIQPPADPGALKSAAEEVNTYHWLIFTSTNAVESFTRHLTIPPGEVRPRIATVGRATRNAAEQKGFPVALTPGVHTADALVQLLETEPVEGTRILLPSAAAARDVLPSELRKRGAIVHVVEAYRNTIPADAPVKAHAAFQPPYPDWVLFASPSAVDHLVSLVGVAPLAHVKIASIGPVTSSAVAHFGLTIAVEASPHTVDGLIHALCHHASEVE